MKYVNYKIIKITQVMDDGVSRNSPTAQKTSFEKWFSCSQKESKPSLASFSERCRFSRAPLPSTPSHVFDVTTHPGHPKDPRRRSHDSKINQTTAAENQRRQSRSWTQWNLNKIGPKTWILWQESSKRLTIVAEYKFKTLVLLFQRRGGRVSAFFSNIPIKYRNCFVFAFLDFLLQLD